MLQTHANTFNGLRTVAGLGEWKDWIDSYETDLHKRLSLIKFRLLKVIHSFAAAVGPKARGDF